MKITVLVESTEEVDGLAPAFGLSLWIEACGARFLFDVGPDDTFLRNAEKLGIDVAAAEFAVLSHGHYDHGGGLGAFHAANARAPVYAARNAFAPRTMHKAFRDRPVGIAPSNFLADRVIFLDADTTVAPGIDLFFARERPGFIPRANRGAKESIGGTPPRPDTFTHEIGLLLREPAPGGTLGSAPADAKTCLITGCSHSGVTNLTDAALALPGTGRIDAVVGGMHLFHSLLSWPFWRRDVRSLGATLATYPVRTWYTGHCTLDSGFEALSSVQGLDVRRMTTGTVISIE